MLYKDFYSFDGDLSALLLEMARWIEEHNPTNPLVVVLEQNNNLMFRIVCDNYED